MTEFIIRGVLRWKDGKDIGTNGAVLAENEFLRWVERAGFEFEGQIGLPLDDQSSNEVEAWPA